MLLDYSLDAIVSWVKVNITRRSYRSRSTSLEGHGW